MSFLSGDFLKINWKRSRRKKNNKFHFGTYIGSY